MAYVDRTSPEVDRTLRASGFQSRYAGQYRRDLTCPTTGAQFTHLIVCSTGPDSFTVHNATTGQIFNADAAKLIAAVKLLVN